MDRTLELGYTAGTTILLTLLGSILTVWWVRERSLSVTAISTFRVEILYWLAILVSNTLGTALGDFLAHDSKLGFLGGALLIGGALTVLLALYALTRVPRILLFWFAFILTRPFGATFGDVLTKPPDEGGIGLGTAISSAILGALLLGGIVMTILHQRRAAAGADHVD